MKKQFTKIKIAAENLSRSNKQDRKDFELETIEKQVEKYRDVLEKMVRKMPAVSTATDTQERDKRIKKNSHYKIGAALEESSKELSKEMPLHHVLYNCGELEKSIAESIVDSELETETEVVRRLKLILDNEIQEITTHKRNVSRTLQEYQSLKRNYEAAIRLDEPQSKINHIKDQQEQCEVKLEKERDSWAAQMFELIAKEDVIVHCIRDYVLNQRNYHERALIKVNSTLANIQDIIQSTVKSRFGTSLTDHLESTNREISYIIELCICCLVENGLYEEGLLRVGCATTKLRRMKHALEAQYVKTPLPLEYQDPHVIGSILKLYLRELPEPLLTYKCYKDFIHAAECGTEAERMSAIKTTLNKLPAANYANLRYLTKFLWLVMQNAGHNKMNSQNLAIVMSPNMLWPRVDKSKPSDYLGQVNSSSAVNVIVELLISQWDYFFDGEVDFFVTLQRNKLFVEGKSKSNSSNENLDKHDGDVGESPRYGTIRRQKACAPSPPMKTQEKAQSNGNNSHGNVTGNGNSNSNGNSHTTVPHISYPMELSTNGEQYHHHQQQQQQQQQHGQRVKELFPNTTNNTSVEKPEKPPLPKTLQLQQQQLQQQQQQQQQQEALTTPKPVPMTRTQFFGLDNLPSPGSERKSSDSGSFKPDLPQKPKIPKRPVALNLNATNNSKSDEETTPTQSSDDISGGGGGVIVGQNVKNLTEKLIDKFRNETYENIPTVVTQLTATTTSNNTIGAGTISIKENNHNQNLSNAEQNANNNNLNSNNNSSTTTTTTTTINTLGALTTTTTTSAERSSINLGTATITAATATTTTTTTPTNNMSTSQELMRITPATTTPTTPVSPNMIQTPKRPTVPAPPPPSMIKKQVD